MPSSLTCPDDAELLAVASGESISEGLRTHLGDCSKCRERLERFQAELALLREQPPETALSPSTVSQPGSNAATANGQADDSHATGPWRPAETSEPQTSEPETDLGFSCDPGATREASLPAAIGKYLVIGRFPRTGQADVFRVVHPGLGKDLVLKLSLTPVRPDGRCEIIEEGKILAELDHPNLVRVYDSDFHEDRPFTVMEYVRGRTLEQVASGGGLKPRQAAALLAKVASAADYAHRKGIVHRDIKPKNILVDEAGEPRLIDFGMARLRHAWSDDPGSPGGTFAFMPPEQARVESPAEQAKVGPRSDVFALGAVLYDLLTRQAPFRGENWRESMDRARQCDFDRKALYDRKIPRDLRGICVKAMAADPADRYPSAEALEKALIRFVNRPKILALAAGAVGLVLLGSLVYTLVTSGPDSTLSQGQTVIIHHTPLAAGALAGELIVRVRSKTGNFERELKVGDPSGLPLLAGEHVHLEARLNQPAYMYLLWLDGQGQVSLLYPRNDGKFGSQPSDGSARDIVHSPAALDEWHPMKGPGGLETVLLLARRTPLPPGRDLAGLVGPLPPSPLRPDLVFAAGGLDEGQPNESLRVEPVRGIGENADRLDDPLLRLMERMRTQGQFDVIKAARFAYGGE
jgi:eukaryotic-like serine/threonine-protein kinase